MYDVLQVSVGEPHCGICFGGRNRKSLMPTDVTITALDHDFHVVSLTPSVSLLVEVPSDTDADPSFYRGMKKAAQLCMHWPSTNVCNR